MVYDTLCESSVHSHLIVARIRAQQAKKQGKGKKTTTMEKSIFQKSKLSINYYYIFSVSGYADKNTLFMGSTGASLELCDSLADATLVARTNIDATRYNVIAMLLRDGKKVVYADSTQTPLFSFPTNGRFRNNVAWVGKFSDDYYCLSCKRAVNSTHKCADKICERCGKVLNSAEKHSKQYFGLLLCADCASKVIGKRYGYHDKPVSIVIDKAQAVRRKTPLLGLELELDSRHVDDWQVIASKLSKAINANPCKPIAYFNRDGSLYDGGIETITLPMTASEMLAVDWARFFNTATAETIGASSACGIHVHCDREYYGDSATKNAVLLFAYVNRYAEHFEKLFGREMGDNSGYAMKLHKGADLLDCSLRINNTRYWAVNVQNDCTIELRTFASTTDTERLHAIIDIAQALFRWAKRATPVSPCRDGFGKWCQYLKSASTLQAICERLDSATAEQCKKWYNHTHKTAV